MRCYVFEMAMCRYAACALQHSPTSPDRVGAGARRGSVFSTVCEEDEGAVLL
jgi:hypothetical protein